MADDCVNQSVILGHPPPPRGLRDEGPPPSHGSIGSAAHILLFVIVFFSLRCLRRLTESSAALFAAQHAAHHCVFGAHSAEAGPLLSDLRAETYTWQSFRDLRSL